MKTRQDSTGLGVRLGVDIGGTFTDLVAEYRNGKISKFKVLTTPKNPAEGVLDAIAKFLLEDGVKPKQVSVVVHATTLASNALLSGSLPKVALVTTEGFRDVLEIGRQNRPELYNLQFERIRPLVPRQYRFELKERSTYDGKIHEPVHVDQVKELGGRIRRLGFESIAICFLHSYANPRNERLVARILRQECPRAYFSVSSDLIPEFREYERTSTTVVNACLQPIISTYLTNLKVGLSSLGLRAPIFVMQSNGGTILSTQASKEPSRIIESGPVAGTVAARAYGKDDGAEEVLSLDIGGTTAKAGAWSGERFDVTTEYEVGGKLHGIQRLAGSGYPIRFPYVDLVEVGTGGGSIAEVDESGVLHVGPESAGASPGPACYRLGGTRPTLTDANLVLGRLSPRQLLGGQLSLDAERAHTAIRKHVAGPMKTSVTAAATGILKIAMANMAQALRAASVERGRDPRSMVLVAFGGAGPMHACELAQQLEIRRVIVPPGAGVLSSMGLLLAEPLHDFVETVLTPASEARVEPLNRIFRKMLLKGVTLLRDEGVDKEDIRFERFFDMRYVGQSYELSVRIQNDSVDQSVIHRAVEDFHKMHEQSYGYSASGMPVEIVNLRTYCRGSSRATIWVMRRVASGPFVEERRRVRFDEETVDECPVVQRGSKGPGSTGRGPCILEDYDSTSVIPTGARYKVDDNGSLHINLD